jgi:hypothetical protein
MNIIITYRHGGDDRYLELIKLAFASAKRLGYNTVLIGDIVVDGVSVKPLIDKDEHLMNWILKAQLFYIESDLFNQDSVFFSPDALIAQPLDKIFKDNFDVALTNRSNRRWPINNGVIFMRPENKAKIAEYWREAIKICAEYPIDIQKWYGDQQSLGDLVSKNYAGEIGLNLKLYPCGKFNCSPRAGYFDASLLDQAKIVHLKGKRKDLMEKYWDALCTKV